MKKDERKGRLSLTLLIAVLVFAIQLFSVVVAIAIIAILMKTGIINELSEELLSLRNALFLMSAISLLAGALLATFSGKLYLWPVNRLINYMNRLASGDFKARIQFGKPIASHPAFQEIETSCNKMAEELERTEMLRSDFINNFSHEFKTPIVSIAGFAKLLKRGNLSPEQQQEYEVAQRRRQLRKQRRKEGF